MYPLIWMFIAQRANIFTGTAYTVPGTRYQVGYNYDLMRSLVRLAASERQIGSD